MFALSIVKTFELNLIYKSNQVQVMYQAFELKI